jgi:hypothetical protein
MVMIVVQYSLHVPKMTVLSNSHFSPHTANRCCCRTKPNQDDSEEVIVFEFQGLFRKTKVLSDSHPCCSTHYRCCCRTKPNQDDSEEVIVLNFKGFFVRRKCFQIVTQVAMHCTDVVVGRSQTRMIRRK